MKIALIAPFQDYKSYCIALEDEDNAQITPLIYLKKSTFITDDEYVKLVKAFQIAVSPKHEVKIIEEKDEKS